RYGYPIRLNEHASTALASLGVTLDLGRPARIAGMAVDQSNLPPAETLAPPWLRAEWVEPIVENGVRVGSVIHLPTRNVRRSHSGVDPSAEVLPSTFSAAIGVSKILRSTIIKAAHLAKARAPVLLLGETGTGKEVFAKSIHSSSPLSEGPFIALNCGSLSKDLLASELFGHREGAFTGSRRGGMIGKIEAADGGTLFLDELGEMPLDLQPQFLRVLEDGYVVRLGDNTPKKINFRLISATNRDLRKDVSEGRFRMDLFYRISVTCLQLPSLRDRPDDIPVLADHFLHQLCDFHKTGPKQFGPEAMTRLQRYPWPGNVRELRNVVESSVLTVPDEVIKMEDLPIELQLRPAARAHGESGDCATQWGVLEQAELDQIFRALEETTGNATLAAQQLGIAKSTLYVKLKKYGLEGHLQSSRH
ncbi:MAG: sigma-54 interaction domain-containing protein, partial [Gammaproteobacteria bacterium]